MIAGSFLLLTACAAKQLPPPQWTYEKEAIRLHIKADNKLNLDEGEAHTLLLCVYQLSDPNTFNQLMTAFTNCWNAASSATAPPHPNG